MRDLGRLGEYTFASMCAQVGLIANGSIIDKTGWDFYVEFPISQNISTNELHKSAVNCKVQVKATDNRDRKWQITLSNLRQMATSQMPSFYVFLEFDSKNEAQRAYVLHIDSEHIYKILKRIREVEQKAENIDLNKKKMTIHYSDKDKLKSLDGLSLQANLLHHIGKNYSEYIENKNKYLKKCGFEDSCGVMKFSINRPNSGVHELVDLSLGLIDEIDIQNVINFDKRFGISSKNPTLELNEANLKIGLQAPKKGKILFKKDNLSRPLIFNIDFYNSPFSFYDYRKYTKFRIVGDFFEMIVEPYANKSIYHFKLGESRRLELKKLKDALALINLMSSENQTAKVELNLDNLEPIVFDFKSQFVERNLEIFDEIIRHSLSLCQKFEIYDDIYVSLNELYQNRHQIEQFHIVINKNVDCSFEVDFEVAINHVFEFEKVASISVFCCRIGNHILGAIVTAFGVPREISKNQFKVDKPDLKIEKTFYYTPETLLKNDDILQSIKNISSLYLDQYDVVYHWGKR